MINSLIINNTATNGAGIFVIGSSIVTLINVTIADNSGPSVHTSGSDFTNDTLTVNNNIIAGSMTLGSSGTKTFNNCIYDKTSPTLTGNNNQTNTDPLLTSDYRLSKSSTARNAGDNTYAAGIELDIGGNPRINEDPIDIGAYEYWEGTEKVEGRLSVKIGGTGNTAVSGAGITTVDGSLLNLTNVTIAYNQAAHTTATGGGIRNVGSTVNANNTIVWGNTNTQLGKADNIYGERRAGNGLYVCRT